MCLMSGVDKTYYWTLQERSLVLFETLQLEVQLVSCCLLGIEGLGRRVGLSYEKEKRWGKGGM